jgi:electron transfer flavoprotein-quinone oxidoreductase
LLQQRPTDEEGKRFQGADGRVMSDKFDVIIAGAGLAGLAAAWTLAGRDLEVLVLERGDYPGAKNVTGGRLYVGPVRGLFPELWADAPFERAIVHEGLSVMAAERSLTFDYTGDELRHPYQSYSVLRSRFDRWFSEQAEAKGAMILTKTRIDDLIREDGKIAGVVAGGEELRSDVVIACDGALSLLAEKAGLRAPGRPEHYAVGIKEVIALDPGTINDRFNLEEGEGAARLYLGDVSRGKFGGGFVYTNRESISLGLVIGIEGITEDTAAPDVPSVLDRFKGRPEIAALIKGGAVQEYSAHIIPESGYGGLGRLYGDGILVAGDAAGFALNIGFTVRGMEYALASGYYAAQACLQARETGDFSARGLSHYKKLLDESFVMEDFRAFQAAPEVLSNPRLFEHYPEWIGGVFRDIYRVGEGPKARLYADLKKHLSAREIWAMIKDARGFMKL